VFWGFRYQAKKDLLHRLDAENYSTSDVVVISMPIALPYPLKQQGYQRVNGEFEYQGEYYSMVKQRLENDTLFMVCIKNHQEKKLVSALNEYTNLVNSLPANAQRAVDLFGKLFKDYTTSSLVYISAGNGWCASIQFAEPEFSTLQHNYPVLSPPPKA